MMAPARRAVVSSSLRRCRRRRLQLVRTHLFLIPTPSVLIVCLHCAAKFQQYMYGGRPLGKCTCIYASDMRSDALPQMYGSTTDGTRSPLAPQRAARPCRYKLTVLCKVVQRSLLVLLCFARLSSEKSTFFPVSVSCKTAIIHHSTFRLCYSCHVVDVAVASYNDRITSLSLCLRTAVTVVVVAQNVGRTNK